MGPPTTIALLLVVALSVSLAQHEGFNVAPPAIHSGVVQYRQAGGGYEVQPQQQLQQYPQPGLQQNSYQVSGSVVAPQQQYGAAQGYNQVTMPQLETAAQLQQPQQQVLAAQVNPASYAMQPPPAPVSPFLPSQGQYALAGQQLQQQQQYAPPPQQQFPGAAYPQPVQQQYLQQPQSFVQQPQQQQFYQRPPVSPAANSFYGAAQQNYAQQPQQLQQFPAPQQQYAHPALPVTQSGPYLQPQQQQYPQAALQQPVVQQQQQTYVQQPLPSQPQPQYDARPQHLQRLPQVQQVQQIQLITPPPREQPLPPLVAAPAPLPVLPVHQPLIRVVELPPLPATHPTAPPPPDRFTPHVADVQDPVSAIAATARPHHAAPVPFETATVIAVDAHAEQVADNRNRAETVTKHPKKLRHKKKKRVKVVETTETVTVAPTPTVSAHRSAHRIITTTLPPAIAPPNAAALRVQQVQQVQQPRPSLQPVQQQQFIVAPSRAPRPHKPSNRPSKLVELTTAASIAAGIKQSPNDVFLQCCKDNGIATSCHSRCNFDTLTKKVLTGMFLGTDPCPQKYGRDMLSCAAQRGDHTGCCMERGVHLTAAKNKCLGFCVMTPGSNFQADISMLPCWAVLNDIKGCFKDAILDQ